MMWRARGAGLIAALLLAAPAGGQGFDVSHHLEYGLLPDDLLPVQGIFSLEGGQANQQLRFVGSQIAPFAEGALFKMIAVADRDYSEEIVKDFAVFLADPPPWGNWKIVTVELPAPSNWYQRLFEERFREEFRKDPYGPGAWRAGMDISVTDYSDVSDSAADNERVRALKRKIRAQMAGRGPDVCEAPIGSALAGRMQDIFEGVLNRTRRSPKRVYVTLGDEISRHRQNFYFTYSWDTAFASGILLKNGRPDLLVEAALAMRDYCRTKDANYLDALGRTLDRLEKRLPDESQYEAPRN